MKFSTHHDLKLPQDVVFERISDFSKFERYAMKRGIRVRRLDDSEDLGQGIKWQLGFFARGRDRSMTLTLTEVDIPNSLHFIGENASLNGRVQIDIIPLSRTQTRLQVASVLEPRTLAARLLVQSMKLARSKFNKRFSTRVAQFAEKLQAGFD